MQSSEEPIVFDGENVTIRLLGGAYRSYLPKPGYLEYFEKNERFVLQARCASKPIEQLSFSSSVVIRPMKPNPPKGSHYPIALVPDNVDAATEVSLRDLDEEQRLKLHHLLLQVAKAGRGMSRGTSVKSSQPSTIVRYQCPQPPAHTAAPSLPSQSRPSTVRQPTRALPEVGDVPMTAPGISTHHKKDANRPVAPSALIRKNATDALRTGASERRVDAGYANGVATTTRNRRKHTFNDETPMVPPPQRRKNDMPEPFPNRSAKKRAKIEEDPATIFGFNSATKQQQERTFTPPKSTYFQSTYLSPARWLPEDKDMDSCKEICGLNNIGLTCYMNAVLQPLFLLDFTEELVNDMRSYFCEEHDERKKVEKVSKKAPLTLAFAMLYSRKQDKERRRSLQHEVKKQMVKAGKFKEANDEDAHEFYVFLLDRIQEELARLRKAPGAGDHGTTFPTDAFKFHLERKFLCSACQKPSCFSEDNNHLILQCGKQDENIEGWKSIPELLADELGVGKDSEQRGCQRPDCSGILRVTKVQMTVRPRYLVLMLQRCAFDKETTSRNKVSSSIALFDSLNFTEEEEKEGDLMAPVMPPDKTPTPSPVRVAQQMVSAADLASSSSSRSPGELPSKLRGSFSSSDTDIVEILEVKQSETQERPYSPVDYEWRKAACLRIGINRFFRRDRRKNVYEPYLVFDAISPTYHHGQAPAEKYDVTGDGNCLFRALSHIITGGDESAHMEVREKICSFMEQHKEEFAKHSGITDFDEYLAEVRREFKWGSDVELHACATMLDTTICTFLEDRWVSYSPRRLSNSNPAPEELPKRDSSIEPDQKEEAKHGKVIYLMFEGQSRPHADSICQVKVNEGYHYDPVLSIPKRMKYTLRAIINHIGSSMQSGHYVNYLRNHEDQWVEANDSRVMDCDRDEALERSSAGGYMLFYELDGRSPGAE